MCIRDSISESYPWSPLKIENISIVNNLLQYSKTDDKGWRSYKATYNTWSYINDKNICFLKDNFPSDLSGNYLENNKKLEKFLKKNRQASIKDCMYDENNNYVCTFKRQINDNGDSHFEIFNFTKCEFTKVNDKEAYTVDAVSNLSLIHIWTIY